MEFSGCVLWLHAEKGVTIATGVSNWADQSGAGNHATQGTGALQPTWVSSGKVGGRANLRFNGTSQYLAMPSIPVAAWTLAMVHTVDSKQGFGGVISNKSAGVVGFVIPNSSSTAYLAERIIRWDGTTETGKTWNTATGMALPLSAKSYVYTSDFTTFKVDDTQLSPLADGGTGWANALTIGAAAGACVGMDLAEVMLWNRVLTAAELLQLRKQMIAAWGVRG